MKNKITKILLITAFVVLSAISCAFAFSFRNMTLDFVQVSDTHITDRQNTVYKALGSSKALLKDAIEQINNIEGLDFVLFTGDMVDSATIDNYNSYYELLKNLHYPHLNTFGNHDFYGMTKEQALEIVKENNRNYTFSDTYYAFSPKTDYRIIVLDSAPIGIESANGEISSEQLQFLDNELSQNQDKICLIALHHPPVEPFVSKDHSIINAKQLNEILIKYKNPIVVVSGHYHAAKIRQIGNIVYVSTPSLVTYPMAFRHIKITNYKDRVKFDFQLISTRLDDVKENNRQSVVSYSTLMGLINDRDTSFMYMKRAHKSASYKRRKINKASKQKTITSREKKKLSKPIKEKQNKKAKKAEKKVSDKKIKELKPPKIKKNKKSKQLEIQGISNE